MKGIKPHLILCWLALLFTSVTFAGYDEALAAYKEKNYALSLSLVTPLVNEGDADAQTLLGDMYFFGNGVELNYDKAFRLYAKAANQGEVTAEFNLGWCYEYGLGTKKDWQRAKELYERAAYKLSANAAYRLGRIHQFGLGDTQKSIGMAKAFYEIAAKQGYKDALYIYAKIAEKDLEKVALTDDETVTAEKKQNSYKEVAMYYREAVLLGDKDAPNELGRMYERGRGAAQNLQKAHDLYLLAIEKGDNWGYANLGYLYSYGGGVDKNRQLARSLYKKSGIRDKSEDGLPHFFSGVKLSDVSDDFDLPARLTSDCLVGDETLFGISLRCGTQSEFVESLMQKGASLIETKKHDEHVELQFDVSSFVADAEKLTLYFDHKERFIVGEYQFKVGTDVEALRKRVVRKHGSVHSTEGDIDYWRKEDGTNIALGVPQDSQNNQLAYVTALSERIMFLEYRATAKEMKKRARQQRIDAVAENEIRVKEEALDAF
ncbi:tetratricopeptide repeat protein [Vibrio paucivorans]